MSNQLKPPPDDEDDAPGISGTELAIYMVLWFAFMVALGAFAAANS